MLEDIIVLTINTKFIGVLSVQITDKSLLPIPDSGCRRRQLFSCARKCNSQNQGTFFIFLNATVGVGTCTFEVYIQEVNLHYTKVLILMKSAHLNTYSEPVEIYISLCRYIKLLQWEKERGLFFKKKIGRR